MSLITDDPKGNFTNCLQVSWRLVYMSENMLLVIMMISIIFLISLRQGRTLKRGETEGGGAARGDKDVAFL